MVTAPPMTDPVPVTQEDREAAAVVFYRRARVAGHPATVLMERHHAKVILAGEGDGYDAVQAAAEARRRLTRPTPDAAASEAGEKWEGPPYEYGVTWGPIEAHPDRLPFARDRAIREAADALVAYAKRMNDVGKEASFFDAHRAILALTTQGGAEG